MVATALSADKNVDLLTCAAMAGVNAVDIGKAICTQMFNQERHFIRGDKCRPLKEISLFCIIKVFRFRGFKPSGTRAYGKFILNS